MSPRRGVLVAEAAWPAVEQALAAGATAVLPIGAAAKEHGYHLPLSTDYLQAEWLGRAIAGAAEVTVWPPLSYGYYPVFIEYPGSISLSRDTFCGVVRELLDGIVRAGARTVALLNTGISTIEPLDAVVREPPHGVAVGLINVYSGARFTQVVREVEEQSFGGHADEIETSIMLALAPHYVVMGRAEPARQRIERGIFNRSDPAAPNYSPSGVNGNPTLATAAKGERLVAAMLQDVLEALAALRGAC
ncbi:MAG: creatininase family protein [Chromatiales bacterium]